MTRISCKLAKIIKAIPTSINFQMIANSEAITANSILIVCSQILLKIIPYFHLTTIQIFLTLLIITITVLIHLIPPHLRTSMLLIMLPSIITLAIVILSVGITSTTRATVTLLICSTIPQTRTTQAISSMPINSVETCPKTTPVAS